MQTHCALKTRCNSLPMHCKCVVFRCKRIGSQFQSVRPRCQRILFRCHNVVDRSQRIVSSCQTVVDRCQRIVLCFVVSLLLQAFYFIILKQIIRTVSERNLPHYLHHAIHFELLIAEKFNCFGKSFHWKVKCCK